MRGVGYVSLSLYIHILLGGKRGGGKKGKGRIGE